MSENRNGIKTWCFLYIVTKKSSEIEGFNEKRRRTKGQIEITLQNVDMIIVAEGKHSEDHTIMIYIIPLNFNLVERLPLRICSLQICSVF